MALIRNASANVINILSSDDSSFSNKIVNKRKSNIDYLETNKPIVNLIVLSDNFEPREGSFEDGC